MMIDFYEALGNDQEEMEIPKEILDILNSELPQNLKYEKDANGNYMVIPKNEDAGGRVFLTSDFDLEGESASFIQQLQQLPKDKIPEYLFRIQKGIRLKNVKIGDKEKQIPLEETLGNPLSDERVSVFNQMIHPAPFQNPIQFKFETEDGDMVNIGIQQKVHDSLTEIYYENTDFLALDIKIYIYQPLISVEDNNAVTSKDKPFLFKYTATPTKASNVEEAVLSLKLCRDFINGTAKINDMSLGVAKSDNRLSEIEPLIEFWENLRQIGNRLEVAFNPKEGFSDENIYLYTELKTSLIDDKYIISKHPFDSFYMSHFHPSPSGISLEKMIDSVEMKFEFTEAPICETLLGAELQLSSNTIMEGFVISRIEWDEKHEGATIYIKDAPEKTWLLKRKYGVFKPDEMKDNQITQITY